MGSIVISADDLGYSAGINKAILQLARDSRIQAVSVLIGLHREAWPEFVNIDLGLHLNATFPPGLISLEKGFDRYRFRNSFSAIEIKMIRDEFRAQFDLFCATFDRFPIHLNAHHGIHRNPQIMDLLIELARESNSFVRAYTAEMVKALKASNVRHVDMSIRVDTKSSITESSHLSSVAQALKSCGDGAYELVCHPGLVDEQLRLQSSMVDSRAIEFSLLNSMKMSSMLHELGFKETRFSAISSSLSGK
jgi:chitin disaccharide deacetylase